MRSLGVGALPRYAASGLVKIIYGAFDYLKNASSNRLNFINFHLLARNWLFISPISFNRDENPDIAIRRIVKRHAFIALCRNLPLFLALATVSAFARAQVEMERIEEGSISLVAHDPTNLFRVDGLAFDAAGNLLGALEIVGPDGGLVYVDKSSGTVTRMVSGISGADQIAFNAGNHRYVLQLDFADFQRLVRPIRADVASQLAEVNS